MGNWSFANEWSYFLPLKCIKSQLFQFSVRVFHCNLSLEPRENSPIRIQALADMSSFPAESVTPSASTYTPCCPCLILRDLFKQLTHSVNCINRKFHMISWSSFVTCIREIAQLPVIFHARHIELLTHSFAGIKWVYYM